MRSCHGCFCSIEIGLLLKFADVLLVPDSFVAKPVGHLPSAGTWNGKGGEVTKKKKSNFLSLLSMTREASGWHSALPSHHMVVHNSFRGSLSILAYSFYSTGRTMLPGTSHGNTTMAGATAHKNTQCHQT